MAPIRTILSHSCFQLMATLNSKFNTNAVQMQYIVIRDMAHHSEEVMIFIFATTLALLKVAI